MGCGKFLDAPILFVMGGLSFTVAYNGDMSQLLQKQNVDHLRFGRYPWTNRVRFIFKETENLAHRRISHTQIDSSPNLRWNSSAEDTSPLDSRSRTIARTEAYGPEMGCVSHYHTAAACMGRTGGRRR